MRNSNSKDKTSTSVYSQNQANRLMKTQIPPKAPQKQSLNTTQYKLPPSNKRIQSSKNLQTTSKPMPVQQVNFDIQNNMTESKIYQAKESLQLLKKKMNRTGMSRQKLSSNNVTSSNNINTNSNQKNNQMKQTAVSLKKIKSNELSKNIQNYQPDNQYEQKNNNTYNKNKYEYEPQNTKTQTRKLPQRQKPVISRQQPQRQNNFNQHEEAPIAKKPDFFALLQMQMQKQANKGNSQANYQNNNYNNKQPFINNEQNDDQGELIQCSKGCGRQFNSNAIVKHEKICEKVFQSKRKAFDASAHRLPDVEGFQKPPQYGSKMNQTKKQPQKQKKANKIPKWKLQSAQLRVGLKTVSNKPISKQQQALVDMQKDALVQCHFCSRKFSDQAAKRHIPFCQTKSKQSNITNARPSNTRKK